MTDKANTLSKNLTARAAAEFRKEMQEAFMPAIRSRCGSSDYVPKLLKVWEPGKDPQRVTCHEALEIIRDAIYERRLGEVERKAVDTFISEVESFKGQLEDLESIYRTQG